MKRFFQCALLTALVASLSLLTGCWNYQELESHYIVSGIAIDKGREGHNYHMTFEVLDLSGGGNGQLQPKVIESEGDTIAEAVDDASKLSDKSLYYSDCKIVVFSRDIAREGLTPVLDWFNRDPKPRITVQLFISKENTAGELFMQGSQSGGGQQGGSQSGGQTGGGQSRGGQSGGVISMQVADSMEAASTGGRSIQMHLYDVDNVLLGEGRDLALPCLKKSGQKNPSVEVDGTAVFRGDKFVGTIDTEQTKDFLILMNAERNNILLVVEKPEDRDIALLVRNSSLAIDPEVNGETIKMHVKVKMECSFDEENSQKNFLLELGTKKIEDLAAETLREHLKAEVKSVQNKFGCDIFGFGRRIYQEKPREWDKLKPSWGEKFRTVSVDVEPEVKLLDAEFAEPKGKA